jgi:hypothetical protein
MYKFTHLRFYHISLKIDINWYICDTKEHIIVLLSTRYVLSKNSNLYQSVCLYNCHGYALMPCIWS